MILVCVPRLTPNTRTHRPPGKFVGVASAFPSIPPSIRFIFWFAALTLNDFFYSL